MIMHYWCNGSGSNKGILKLVKCLNPKTFSECNSRICGGHVCKYSLESLSFPHASFLSTTTSSYDMNNITCPKGDASTWAQKIPTLMKQQRRSFHNRSNLLTLKVQKQTIETKAKTIERKVRRNGKQQQKDVFATEGKVRRKEKEKQTRDVVEDDVIESDQEYVVSGKRKRLDVAIVGLPNAGKSQLLNVLTNSNVAAVSRKRHTTRDGIMGVYTSKKTTATTDPTQVVFIDTPGFLNLRQAKEEQLMRDLIVTATSSMETVDYTLVVIDAARRISDDVREATVALMLHALTSQGRDEINFSNRNDTTANHNVDDAPKHKFAIVLNKVDLIRPKSKLLDIAIEFSSMADQCVQLHHQKRNPCVPEHDENIDKAMRDNNTSPSTQLVPDGALLSPIFYVSAKHKEGTDDITNHLLKLATFTHDEWLVTDPNRVTDMDYGTRIEELIRQGIYRCTHREVPHHVRQKNLLLLIKENENKKPALVTIHQDLIVETKSHQRLVKGTGNKTLARIHDSAVKNISEMFGGCPIDLQLRVTLKKSKNRNN